MEDDILSRSRRITDRRAAAALADPLRRRLVLMLAGQEHSLAALAASIGTDIKRLHYHVAALVRLRLVRVARTQRRAGRPIKFYRAAADAFFVSHEMGAPSPHAALDAELRESIARLRDPSLEGVLYYVDAGAPRMRMVETDPRRAITHAEYWRIINLSRADAERLAKEVANCFQSFVARDPAKARPHLVHFAIAPRR